MNLKKIYKLTENSYEKKKYTQIIIATTRCCISFDPGHASTRAVVYGIQYASIIYVCARGRRTVATAGGDGNKKFTPSLILCRHHVIGKVKKISDLS